MQKEQKGHETTPNQRTRRIADVCAALARDSRHGVPPHGGAGAGTAAGGKVANARREELGCRRDRLVAER